MPKNGPLRGRGGGGHRIQNPLRFLRLLLSPIISPLRGGTGGGSIESWSIKVLKDKIKPYFSL